VRGTRRGTAAAGPVVFAAVVVLAYTRHVLSPGFWADDWLQVAEATFQGYTATVAFNAELLGSRPLLAVLLPAPATLVGPDPTALTLIGLALAVAVVVLLVRALVVVGVPPRHAWAVGVLAVLLPTSSGTRLWPTGALNNTSVLLVLAGLLVTLTALRRSGWTAAALHALGLLLYVASAATYEAAVTVVPLFFLAYLRRTSLRRAASRTAVDTAVIGTVVVVSALATRQVRGVAGLRPRVLDLPSQLRDATSLVVDALTPGPVPRAAVVLLPALLVVATTLVLTRTRPDADAPSGRALGAAVRPWALGAVASGLFALGSLLPFSGGGLNPGSPGIDDRGNVVLTLPVAAAVYCLLGGTAAALTTAAGAPPARRRQLTAVLLTAATALVAVGAWYDLQREIDRWHDASRGQERVLSELERLVPEPPESGVLFVSGFRGESSPGLPVFWLGWGLRGAVQLRYDAGDLSAYGVFDDVRVVCAPDRVFSEDGRTGEGMDPGDAASYGSAVFVDVRAGTVQTPADQDACRDVVEGVVRMPRFDR
jgi:hypothetical protein